MRARLVPALAARLDGALPGLVAFAAIGLTGAANGGYWPTAWGWSAAGLLSITALGLVVRERLEVGALDGALLAGVVGFLLWTSASAVWSDSVPATALEVERLLVYVGGVAAVLVLAHRSPAPILAGVLGAIAVLSTYGLATRLFPDVFGRDPALGLRLARPIGYWNAIGILAAMGILLAIGHASFDERRRARALASASLVVLAATLYFTFSRGAWVALVAGGVVAILAEPRRARYLTTVVAVSPAPLLAVWVARRSPELARVDAPLEAATAAGHRLAAVVVALAAAAGAVSLLLGSRQLRLHLPRRARRTLAASFLVLTAAGAAGAVIRAGGAENVVGKAYDSFRGPAPGGEAQLERRLFSFSGTSRLEYWQIAWEQYRAHPGLGSGAGTFEYYWNRDRETVYGTRDAHNLYLETLAELGPVGLLVLASTFGVALVAARGARRHPLGATALAGLSAYLLHAAVDWDWELPTITLAGLLCAAALAVGARRDATTVRPRGRARAAALALTALLGAFAVIAYRGNVALARSADFGDEAVYERAAAEARVAARWLPWSADPWRALGEAELALGERAAARTSFRRGLDRDRRDWRLWLGLALASDGGARRDATERAAELNPFGVMLTLGENR